MDTLFKNLYLPNAGQTKLNPSFGQVMSSAFNLENDVVNLLDYISDPAFKADENFDFKSEFSASQAPDEWMPLLSKSLSKPEFDFNLAKVRKEYQDKAVLAASGWGGTVAALSAGMLSPTVFIPFSGQARGAAGFAEILALAAVGAGAQNGALFLNQATRTEAELYEGIAMDTLLMGAMGGAYMGLTRGARSNLANRVVDNNNYVDVPVSAAPLKASETKRVLVSEPELTINDLPPVASNQNGVPDAEAVMSPLPRAAYPYDLMVPRKAVEKEPLIRATNEAYAAAPIERVRLSELTTDVDAVGRSRIEDASDEPVLVEKIGNTFFLRDGNHRAAAAFLRGDTSIEAKVVDMNPVLKQFQREVPEVKVEPGMVGSNREAAIPASNPADTASVGAAVARPRNTLGAKAAPNKARQASLDALGKLSPAYRMLTQRFFPSLRDAIAKIDLAGIQQAGLEAVQPSASGGTVMERIRGYDPHIVFFAQALDKEYYRYIHGTDKGFDLDSPAITQIKSHLFGPPQGKMRWLEFKEATFDGLSTGEPLPEVARASEELKKFFAYYNDRHTAYLKELQVTDPSVEPLYKELMEGEFGEGSVNYVHHIFSKQKLMRNMQEFIDDFAGYNRKNLEESFAKAQERFHKRQNKRRFELMISDMTPEDISARLASVESDLEFLEELPEWQDFRTERLSINRQAKEEGWPKEQLKAQLKDLQDNLPAEAKKLQTERKELMAVAKALRKFGGDSAEKTAELRKKIDKADELIDEMFRHELPGIKSADLSIGRLQAQSDAAVKSVNSALTKLVKAMGARHVKLSKLLNSKRNNTASRAKVMEQLEKMKARQEELLYRLETVKGQQVARDDQLRELAYIREAVVQDATRLVRKRAAALEDLEDRLEEAAGKLLTPEERARMKAQIEEEIERSDYDFEMLWTGRGEMSGDTLNTKQPDFKDKSREMAVMLHQKLTNSEIELSPAYKVLRQDARGAELLRVMNIPYAIKQKWLEKDVELVTRAYDRNVAPDLELWYTFGGSPNATSILGAMQDEATQHLLRINSAKFVKLPKGWTDKAADFSKRVQKVITEFGEADDIYLDAKNFSDTGGDGFIPITPELRNQLSQAVADAVKASTRDVDVAIQRLRGTRSVPDDADSILWRTGRAVKDLNVLTMMGGVLPASVSDVARPIWRHGVSRTFRHGWAPFLNKLNDQAKAFRIRSKEINQRIGLNLEPMLHSRAQGAFDLADDTIGKNRLERGLRLGANKMGLIAMYDYWTAGMKTIAGNVFHATAAEYFPQVGRIIVEGGELADDALQMRTYLRNLGLSDVMIVRIARQMEKPGGLETFSNGGVLPNIGAWDDLGAFQAYQAACLKEVNELIVTPGLERPNIVDENLAYSLIFQFKSFTFSSTSRMAMSGLQGNEPYLMQGIAFSLAFGALSYYTYAVAAGGKTQEKMQNASADDFLWEAVKRSGVLGVMSLGTDAMEKIPGLNGKEPTPFTKPTGLLGAFLGPTYGQLEKMATVITQSTTQDDKQKQRNLHMLRQVWVPLQNHFLLRRLFDNAEEALIGG